MGLLWSLPVSIRSVSARVARFLFSAHFLSSGPKLSLDRARGERRGFPLHVSGGDSNPEPIPNICPKLICLLTRSWLITIVGRLNAIRAFTKRICPRHSISRHVWAVQLGIARTLACCSQALVLIASAAVAYRSFYPKRSTSLESLLQEVAFFKAPCVMPHSHHKYKAHAICWAFLYPVVESSVFRRWCRKNLSTSLAGISRVLIFFSLSKPLHFLCYLSGARIQCHLSNFAPQKIHPSFMKIYLLLKIRCIRTADSYYQCHASYSNLIWLTPCR